MSRISTSLRAPRQVTADLDVLVVSAAQQRSTPLYSSAASDVYKRPSHQQQNSPHQPRQPPQTHQPNPPHHTRQPHQTPQKTDHANPTNHCLSHTTPTPRDSQQPRMPHTARKKKTTQTHHKPQQHTQQERQQQQP